MRRRRKQNRCSPTLQATIANPAAGRRGEPRRSGAAPCSSGSREFEPCRPARCTGRARGRCQINHRYGARRRSRPDCGGARSDPHRPARCAARPRKAAGRRRDADDRGGRRHRFRRPGDRSGVTRCVASTVWPAQPRRAPDSLRSGGAGAQGGCRRQGGRSGLWQADRRDLECLSAACGRGRRLCRFRGRGIALTAQLGGGGPAGKVHGQCPHPAAGLCRFVVADLADPRGRS